MRKLILIILLPILCYSQINIVQPRLWQRYALGIRALSDYTYFLSGGGLRFYGGQIQFSNNLTNWYAIPQSLPSGAGWTLGLNKIYQTTIGDKFYWRMTASDTTATTHDFYVGGTARFTRPVQFDSGFVLSNPVSLNKGGYAFSPYYTYISANCNQNINAIEFYIYPIVSNTAILNFGTNYQITYNSSMQLQFGSGFTNVVSYVNGIQTNRLALNKWNFVTINFDAITPSILEIGRYSSTHFSGFISFVRLYNKNISIDEHIKFYNNGYPELSQLPYELRGALGQNLVRDNNDTFENLSILHFGTYSSNNLITVTNEDAHSGSYSLKCVRNDISENRSGYTYIGLNHPNGIVTNTLSGKLISLSLWVKGKGQLQMKTLQGSLYSPFFDYSDWTQLTFQYIVPDYSALTIYHNTVGDTLYIDDIVIKTVGCVAEYKPENAGSMGWLDASGNNFHAVTYNSPTPLSSYRDYKSGISTTTVQMVNSQKAFTILEKVIVKNNYAGTNTFYLGTSTNANELLNGVSLANGETKVFDVNSYSATTRSLYVKAGNSNVDVIFIYKPIGD